MVVADKSDLMGAEETKKIGTGLFSSNKVVIKDKSNVFSLGDRVNVISTTDSGILLGHVVEEQNLVYYKSLGVVLFFLFRNSHSKQSLKAFIGYSLITRVQSTFLV